MSGKQRIADLVPGEAVEGLFLLASAQLGQSRNGPYWRVEYRDSSGSMEGKIWSPVSRQFTDLKPGLLVSLRGRVVLYRERGEIAVEAMRVLDEEQVREVDWSDFLPSAGREIAVMWEELEECCRRTFLFAPWRKLCRLLLKDEEISAGLRLGAAAKGMHHAYAGGLLEHTLGVCRAALALADVYPRLDRQALLAGALCHDLGKIRELGSGLMIDYTTPGRLAGHISLGLEMLEPFPRRAGLEADLAEHLKHLVLSHHGALEFGSPCLPATAEALALHFADNLDAKLNQVETALAVVPEGESGWSNFEPGLARRLFRPRATPPPPDPRAGLGTDSREEGAPEARERQCSLPLKE